LLSPLLISLPSVLHSLPHAGVHANGFCSAVLAEASKRSAYIGDVYETLPLLGMPEDPLKVEDESKGKSPQSRFSGHLSWHALGSMKAGLDRLLARAVLVPRPLFR
jgi:hypothetical protein